MREWKMTGVENVAGKCGVPGRNDKRKCLIEKFVKLELVNNSLSKKDINK